MSKKLSTLACCLMLGVVACTDTGLEDKVNSLESRVAKLESEVSRLNSDFVTLKSLVDKLSNGYLVESCTPVADGYLIKFTDNTSVTIRHGKDGTDGVDGTNGTNGQDGKTPSIGLRKDELDGNWYWTLNGEWLKDASGNRVKANGTDGKDGVTPQVKVEDGYWWLSTDGGISWTVLSPYYDATATLIASVDSKSSSRYVYITLTDGTVLSLPCKNDLAIQFDGDELAVLDPGESCSLGFTLTGGTPRNTVKAVGQGGWIASVTMESSQKGVLHVTAPDPIVETEVIVLVSDGEGYTLVTSLNLVRGTLRFAEDAKSIGAEGGSVSLKVTTNIAYTPVPDVSWVSLDPSTKAVREDVLTFLVEPNEGLERHCTINLMVDGKVKAYAVISQESGITGDFLGILSGSGTVAYKFNKKDGQTSLFTAEGSTWFRFLIPSTLSCYELGPIPDGVQIGDSFLGALTLSLKGTIEDEQALTFQAIGRLGDRLTLQDNNGQLYYIRF